MIKVIYGAKGTGKTKQMIDAANEAVKPRRDTLCLLPIRNAACTIWNAK